MPLSLGQPVDGFISQGWSTNVESLRFLNHLGHEFDRNLQASWGCGAVAILANEVLPVIDEELSRDDDNFLANDFHKKGIERKEVNNQSVHVENKVIFSAEYKRKNKDNI